MPHHHRKVIKDSAPAAALSPRLGEAISNLGRVSPARRQELIKRAFSVELRSPRLGWVISNRIIAAAIRAEFGLHRRSLDRLGPHTGHALSHIEGILLKLADKIPDALHKIPIALVQRVEQGIKLRLGQAHRPIDAAIQDALQVFFVADVECHRQNLLL